MSLPPQDQIDRWKEEYGNVYSTNLVGIDFVFRVLTFNEFDATLDRPVTEAEDLIVHTILYPKDVNFDSLPAGVVSSLAMEILEISGFGDPKRARLILEQARERVGDVWGLMKSFVLAAMPSYKEEELDTLTFKQMAHKVALAERVIKVNQVAFGMEDGDLKLDLIDPEEEELKEARKAQQHAAQNKPGQAGYEDPIAKKLHEAFGG